DTAKSASNKSKRGIEFEDAATVFLDPLLFVMSDLEHSDMEERWIAPGKSSNQLLLVVVHTEDDLTIRIISARNETIMSDDHSSDKNDEMRDEYDFTNAVRGKYDVFQRTL